MDKKKLIFVLGVLFMVFVAFFFFGGENFRDATITPTPTSTVQVPEDGLDNLDTVDNEPEGPFTVKIIGPEEPIFDTSQARFYKAEISNLGNNRGVCYWKFYLNEYDEEVLYKEQEVRASDGWCGFTSTFIDRRGELRVTVTAEKQTIYKQEVLDTATDEKSYSVR